jgi:hypothetical protein
MDAKIAPVEEKEGAVEAPAPAVPAKKKAVEAKKKPGRPRIKPLKTPLKRKGISATPLNAENMTEMIYDMPSVFKSISAIFRSMAAKELCMVFNEKEIHMLATDHVGASHVKVIIKCDKINHYYCKEPTKIYLSRKSMDKIIAMLDKNYLSVAFILKTLTSRSKLTIIYKNDSPIEECRTIELAAASNNAFDVSFDDTGYPIKFDLKGKYFKKLIGNVHSCSNKMTINKIGESAMTFTHGSRDGIIDGKYIVKDPNAINLVSTVARDDIFASTVELEYIKPLSSAVVSESVSVSADTHKNMIFKCYIDDKTVQIVFNTTTVKLKAKK